MFNHKIPSPATCSDLSTNWRRVHQVGAGYDFMEEVAGRKGAQLLHPDWIQGEFGTFSSPFQ